MSKTFHQNKFNPNKFVQPKNELYIPPKSVESDGWIYLPVRTIS